jgi:hypothetical protein
MPEKLNGNLFCYWLYDHYFICVTVYITVNYRFYFKIHFLSFFLFFITVY